MDYLEPPPPLFFDKKWVDEAHWNLYTEMNNRITYFKKKLTNRYLASQNIAQ